MQIRQLEYFLAVCEHLNFTKAARQFYISQTAVSLQIQTLEEELGVRLFNRTNRRGGADACRADVPGGRPGHPAQDKRRHGTGPTGGYGTDRTVKNRICQGI